MNTLSDPQRRQLILFSALVGFFVFYHFAVGGIPVFSPDVETARFHFTSSGLFGIPGRMFLYGWPFVVLQVTLYYWRTRDNRSKWLFYAVWAAFVLVSSFGGFKSSVLRVFGMIVLSRTLVGRPLRIRELFSAPVLALVALAVLYAGWMSFRYGSVGVTDVPSMLNYMKLRMCALPAQPGHFAMTYLASGPQDYPHVVQDMFYFLRKYFGLSLAGPDTFPLDMIVSSAIYNVPLSREAWIVPVTVGAFAEWYVDAGLLGSFAAMCLIGVLLAYAISRCISARGTFAAAAWGLGVHRILAYIGNGNLAHTLLNFVAVLGFLAILQLLASLAVQFLAFDIGRAPRRLRTHTPRDQA